ncbi:MAG: hypothetical protein V4787_16115 [Pseudomonadota bacterium]
MKKLFAPSPTLMLHCAAIALAVLACTVSRTTVDFQPSAHASADELLLRELASFRLELGRVRELPAGSRWRAVGSVAQGTVYRAVNSVFVMQGRHAGEAYPVVKGGRLQGFFLPREASFSPVHASVALAL